LIALKAKIIGLELESDTTIFTPITVKIQNDKAKKVTSCVVWNGNKYLVCMQSGYSIPKDLSAVISELLQNNVVPEFK